MKTLLALFCLITSVSHALDHCRTTCWTAPKYCGGVYSDITWLYLQSCPSDGDLETATFLTLTVEPNNLHAVLQDVDPGWESAVRALVGYQLPSTNMDVGLSYFYYCPSGSNSLEISTINQLFQNFLGGAYATMNGHAKQEVQQADILAGWQFHLDRCFGFHPFFGFTFAKIDRNLRVRFTDEILSENPSALTGNLTSHYKGAGPLIGADFSYQMLPCLEIGARIGGGVLFGEVESSTHSLSIIGEEERAFNTTHAYDRAIPVLNSRVGLSFKPNCQFCNLGLAIKAGYEADYYFKCVDRYDPYNGYVVNNAPFPVRVSSNLGLSGPFVELSIFNIGSKQEEARIPATPHFDEIFCGFYGEVKNAWLKPLSNNDDLVYATLNQSNGSIKKQQASPHPHWGGLVKLGFRTCEDLDFSINYFHFDQGGRGSVLAGAGEEIFSVDASGVDTVAYSEADSKVKYTLNQVDLQAGKCFSSCGQAKLLLSAGVRYAQLERTMHNQYNGGVPSENFALKQNELKSRYWGAGPFVRIDPSCNFSCGLQLTGFASFSLLAGAIRSTLDQQNQGTVSETSNTLRDPETCAVVPVIDVGAGLSYHCDLGCGTLILEAGYQFSDYFRAVNLVYPTFLTGLEQLSSDFRLHGPYVTITFANF